MDRVLKLLEAKTAPLPAKATTASAIEAARDKVKAKLQEKEDEYTEFRRGSSLLPVAAKGMNPVIERLGKIEARRVSCGSRCRRWLTSLPGSRRRTRTAARKKATKRLCESSCSLVSMPRRVDGDSAEIIIERLDRERKKLATARGEKEPGVADVDSAIALVRKIYAGKEGPDARDYINTMKDEIGDLSTRLFALDNIIDAEAKTAREMNLFQVKDERMRHEIDGLRNKIKVLDSLLADDEAQKPK